MRTTVMRCPKCYPTGDPIGPEDDDRWLDPPDLPSVPDTFCADCGTQLRFVEVPDEAAPDQE